MWPFTKNQPNKSNMIRPWVVLLYIIETLSYLSFKSTFFAVNLVFNKGIYICNPPLHLHKYFPQRGVCFWKSHLMTHTEFKKKEKQGIFGCNKIFSYSQMFPFIAQHEEVNRGRKAEARKARATTKKASFKEKISFRLQYWTCLWNCLSVEQCVWSWRWRAAFQVTRKSSHRTRLCETCASLWKLSNFYSKTPRRTEALKNPSMTFTYI